MAAFALQLETSSSANQFLSLFGQKFKLPSGGGKSELEPQLITNIESINIEIEPQSTKKTQHPPTPTADSCILKKIRNSIFGASNNNNSISSAAAATIAITSSKSPNSLLNDKSALSFLCSEATLCGRSLETAQKHSPFIDPCDLRSRLGRLTSQANQLARDFIIILLDCRSFSDFNSKRIQNSIHVNCRDKLSKKRLLTRKITFKDILNADNKKNKFDLNNNSSSPTEACVDTVLSSLYNNNENLIIIYDDTTSEADELQSDSNPLKIVSDNIKQTSLNKECKILKGKFYLILFFLFYYAVYSPKPYVIRRQNPNIFVIHLRQL